MIAQYRKTGRVQRRQRTVAGFKQKYTEHDIRLLAAMDERHDTPCGPAIKKRCERAYEIFGQTEYASLATISVSPSVQPEKVHPLHSPTVALRKDPAQGLEDRRTP